MKKKTRIKARHPQFEALEDRRLLATTALDFSGGAGGISNTGFTAVLPTSSGKGLISSNLALSGGKLLLTTTTGDFWQTRNTQDNALNLAVDASADFSVQTRMTALPFTKNWQNGGIFVGTNQDNYVKIVAGYSGGTSLQLGNEISATFASPAFSAMSFASITSLDLRLVGTASSKTVVASYRINSDSDTAWVTLGQATNANVFSSSAKAGVVTTNFFATPVTAAFDSFTVTQQDVVVPPPPPPPPPPPTTVTAISLDFNGGAGGINDTGFLTTLPTSKGTGLISGNIAVSNGRLNLKSTAGDLWQTRNNQDNALAVPTDVSARDFTLQTRLAGLPFTTNWQNGGIFVGPNEDNYVKLVIGYSGGTSIQLGTEAGAVFSTPAFAAMSTAGITSLDLRLQGTSADKKLVASYRINSDSESAWVTLGSVTNAAVFSTSAKAGIVTTNFGAAAMTVPFDSFVLADGVVAPPPPPPPPPPTDNLTVGANVNATRTSGNQVETEVAINPTNANNMVVISQNQTNNSANLLVSRSYDGGKTWANVALGNAQDKMPASTPRVDPHVTFDAFGNAYVAYMVAASSTELRMIVARSSDGGATWTATYAVQGQGLTIDYPSIATGVDATNKSRQAVFLTYTDSKLKRVRIVSAVSTGLGNLGSWSAPTSVSDGNGSYASVAVGLNGEVAVIWQTNINNQGPAKINMDVDSDGLGTAKTWGTDKLIANTNVGGFDYITPQPNRSIDANPQLQFDKAPTSSTKGRLYVVYTDEDGNESNDTDIILRYSNDLGTSWSNALTVNDDTTVNAQFLPVLAVDQTTGNVAVVWHDARNSAGNNTAQIYGTVSLDHGVSVKPNIRISTGTSNQAGANGLADDLDFGDWAGLSFYNGKFIASWCDNSNSTGDNPDGANRWFDIYTAVVTLS